MKQIPYGDSNFEKIVSEGSFFIDKTPFLALLEATASNIVFLRPRRFGKSLWVSVMQYYYGLEHQFKFDTLFRHLTIGRNLTALANAYLVLKFDFSGINTKDVNSTEAGFLKNVYWSVGNFLSAYKQFFTPEQRTEIFKASDPGELVKSLFNTWSQNNIPHSIYLMVDEYDHFANELIAFRLPDFKTMLSENGFVRKFYETIKTATQSGAVDRVFITGVSPITLDSLTSGFNITTSGTTELSLHDMLGFTADQVKDTLRNVGASEAALPQLLADLEHWYDGYRFHPESPVKLYNSGMVLYFAMHYKEKKKYPIRMLDINIASDYGKIRQTFRIADREAVNQTILHQVLTTGNTSVYLTDQYSFERTFSKNDFKSLLFYMGYLTISSSFGAEWILKIPNQVIRELYWDYFAALTLEQTDLVVQTDDLIDAIHDLTMRNNPNTVVQLVSKTLRALSNRDNQNFDEKHLKAIMASYLSVSPSYLMRSEFEAERQYVDILLLKRLPFEMPYQFAFELKYLKTDALAAEIAAKEAEAEAQLRQYIATAELQALKNLRSWLVVFSGTELKALRQL